MIRTFKLDFNDKTVLKIAITGSDFIVKKLTEDTFFNSVLRNSVEELVKEKTKRIIESDKK